MTQAFLQTSKPRLRGLIILPQITQLPCGRDRIWILKKSGAFISSTLTHCFLLCVTDLHQEKERQWAPGAVEDISTGRRGMVPRLSMSLTSALQWCFSIRSWLLSKICWLYFLPISIPENVFPSVKKQWRKHSVITGGNAFWDVLQGAEIDRLV